MKRIALPVFFIFITVVPLLANWPIYKGNLYFTGNNDQIVVKNGNLKWLYQAESRVFNPVVSDGAVYFLDLKKNLYCLDEQKGTLRWKINLVALSQKFQNRARVWGKIKYPLIQDGKIFITDSIVIYALDAASGQPLWARAGMRNEENPGSYSRAVVDGIYADPIIYNDTIFYGTRNRFFARDIRNGHLKWGNEQIKSMSGFPTFYDLYILTQSMDYSAGVYRLYMLDQQTGRQLWQRSFPKPFKILSPVVYQGKVFFPVNKSLYCLDRETGKTEWVKNYNGIITAPPGFTDESILMVLDNRSIIAVDPEDGTVRNRRDYHNGAAPLFVTMADQFYTATMFSRKVGGRDLPYTRLQGMNLFDDTIAWEFIPPFPGAPSQPVASGGIMFQPAGNYLYAVGTDYYPRDVDGGSGHYDVNDEETGKDQSDTDNGGGSTQPTPPVPPSGPAMRDLDVTVKDGNGRPISSSVDVIQWKGGVEVYRKRIPLGEGTNRIKVPAGDGVELIAGSPDHVPDKARLDRNQKEVTLELDRMEKGQTVTANHIYFEVNQAWLIKESLALLDNVAEVMKRNPRLKIEVRGHTDATGSAAHNMQLSQRRARAVVQYLIKQGISPERLVARGFGETQPVATNNTPEGRQKNRRTEFKVLDK